MDNSKTVTEFEHLLKKESSKKPCRLYNKDLNTNGPTYKPKDVIEAVYSQMKAIHMADCSRSLTKSSKETSAKKSKFLAINKLPMYNQDNQIPAPNQNKFETQCDLDTQIMNIIDGVEAIGAHDTGMTQEFDITFNQIDENIKISEEIDSLEISNEKVAKPVSSPVPNHDGSTVEKNSQGTDNINAIKGNTDKTERIIINDPNIEEEKALQSPDPEIKEAITTDFIQNTELSKTATENTITFIQNELSTEETDDDMKEIDSNSEDMDMDARQNNERSSSPVLNVQTRKRKSKTPSPLVVSLETFEHFENIAIPLVENNADYETAKHLINSQILGGELCLNTEHLFGMERNYSPILELKGHELKINSQDIKTSGVEKICDDVTAIKAIKNYNEKRSGSLKDEILFSSDEENEFYHRAEELALTCVLEIPFCDPPSVLDKTMYVGFQTASNKPIQISTDSFGQAQSILENNDETVKEFSLTELVEKCDVLKSKLDESIHCLADQVKDATVTHEEKTKNDEKFEKELDQRERDSNKLFEKSDTQVKSCIENEETSKKQSFEKFLTTNFKMINMSEKAFQKCQKVFQDIDLNENLNLNSDKTITACVDENKNKDVNVEEVINDDKINDELLLQEFENIEMSLEEKENKNENIFEGFKTANNKDIKISKEALAKTNLVFQNIEQENIIDAFTKHKTKKVPAKLIDTPSGSGNTISFKTANNKTTDVSNKAFAKTKSIFQDIEINNEVDIIENINQPSTSKAVFIGFKTANNKNIKISDEALSKTKSVFKDIDRETSEKEVIDDINQPSTSKAVFQGFKTASNKNINISDNALIKSKNMFNDIDENDLLENENKEPVFKGFKTASNKNVKVSEQALTTNKKIFQDIDMAKDKLEDKLKVTTQNTKLEFIGFKTANNKAVNISEKALENSKKLFADVNIFEDALTVVDKDDDPVFKGFQTASKKPVSVSADALAKSKTIFQDIDEDNESVLQKMSSNIKNVGFKGFQTANKKPVEVSKQAVLASQKLLNDLDGNLMENFKSGFGGFKTASNKNVNISDEALAKYKRIFDDIDETPKPSKELDGFKGFQTANSKDVEISKDALEKAKCLFDRIEDYIETEPKKFEGFQTGNHEKVTVSKQSLAKSKHLFHDINTENHININNKENLNDISDVKGKIEVKNHPKAVFGFQTGHNKKIEVSETALKKSKKLFAEDVISNKDKKLIETKKVDFEDNKLKSDTIINIDGILDTQVLNNFEKSLCTEDFNPNPNKRSGSPILSCPRAKKRKKFETPYRTKLITKIDSTEVKDIKKPANIIKFKDDYKKNKIYTYKDLTKLESGKTKTVDPYILGFNLENILNFEFDNARNDLTEITKTVDDVKQLFIEATDKKLIPEGWMDIQLKLILWKLISYEIKFPESLGTVCTVQNVINQLKYRYDRELYNAERPVLRKILEKDDVPSKTMVLCVAMVLVDGVSVTSVNNPTNIELLLTDGWYFIKATIDKMLSALVYERKIAVGTKIMVSGAELVNCEQGVAPWEDISSVRLSISGNSTVLARSTCRLGLCPGGRATRLAAVRAAGGAVRRLRSRLARCYPPLYVERLGDGSTVTRSERLEYQYQMKYEAEREAMVEKIYEEVEKEFTEQASQDSEGILDPCNKRKGYDSGSQIAKVMKTSKDPMEFRAHLTSTQVQLLQQHTSAQRDKYLQAIQDRVRERMRPRDVVTLVRGRIVDLTRKGDKVIVTKGMLSVWKPNEEVLDIFKEGSWFEVMNIIPTGVRNSEIQLSAGRQSVFRRLKHKEDEIVKPYWETLKRNCYKIKDVSQNPSMTTEYNEIDTVGIIFSIEPTNREFESIKNQFQNLYLADVEKNMICVNFWGGIQKFGYENVLDTGQVIYCGNLQKRAGNTRKNIPQYRATEFSLFTKSPKYEKGRETIDEINKKMFGLDRRKFCEDCLAVKQNYSFIKCLIDTDISPYRFQNGDYNLAKNKMFIDTPIGVKVAKSKQDDLSLTGLDFESTFKQQDTQELSPKTLLRKKKVNEKIARLKMYGEPPPLSPINIINQSKNAANSFKSPLLSKNDGVATPNKTSSVTSVTSTVNAATPKKLPNECVKIDVSKQIVSSPVLAMNRTYVMRSSVNPVKLNFSESAAIEENADSTVDHFAEDFDGSPPLSLD